MRIGYIHAGMPKTGSSAIQRFLLDNADTLERCGLFVPKNGFGPAGHLNLARQLTSDERFDPAHGTLEEALEQANRNNASALLLTSENFSALYANRAALATFAQTLRSAGYAPRVIIFLRPRLEAAESIYAQMVRHGLDCGFDEYLETILTAGNFPAGQGHEFRYAAILEGFAQAFGHDNLIALPYDAATAASALRRYFDCISAQATQAIDFASLHNPGRVNESLNFRAVLDVLLQNARRLTGADGPEVLDVARARYGSDELSFLEGPFRVTQASDRERFESRFADDRSILSTAYGLDVPAASPGTHAQEPDACALETERRRRVMRDACSAWGLDGFWERSRKRGRALVARVAV